MKNKGIVIGVFAVVFILAAVLLIVCLNPPKPAGANIDSTPKKINEIEGFEEILASPVTAVEIRDLVSAGLKNPLTDEDILQSVNDFLNNSKFSCIGLVPDQTNMNGGGGDYVTLTTEKGEFKFNAVSGKGKMWLWISKYEYEVIGNEGNVFDEAFRLGYERYVK
ncbi:MAG: hypothetical protein E7548_04330 [Ruminococcaceae bacterium]|nr:hypothetical protein [Oscillospiraceae bacterium]